MYAELPRHEGDSLRVVTANLSSGRQQNYDLGHGERILQAVDADVILIQEFNVGKGSTGDLRKFVDSVCGKECDYIREEANAGDIPNGIISKYPIVASGVIDDPTQVNREFVWADIDLPVLGKSKFFSVHLSTKSAKRADAGAALKKHLEKISERQPVIVGGDFNASSSDEPVYRMFSTLFGKQSLAQGINGKHGTNQSRTKPYDQIFVSEHFAQRPLPISFTIGEDAEEQSYRGGLIFDCRDFPRDITSPADASDSNAEGMQHQMVVRDFSL